MSYDVNDTLVHTHYVYMVFIFVRLISEYQTIMKTFGTWLHNQLPFSTHLRYTLVSSGEKSDS